jgi:hypothetical protein
VGLQFSIKTFHRQCWAYLLRLKNIIALAPFHREFELTSFQCQLKGPNKLSLLMDLPFYHQLLGHLIVNKLRWRYSYQGEFDLLGFKIGNWYVIDKCLPMGCSVSCSHFERFSSFLHWITEMESDLHEIDHYLDDFLFANADFTSFLNTVL